MSAGTFCRRHRFPGEVITRDRRVLDEIPQRRHGRPGPRRLLMNLLAKQDWLPRRTVTDRLPAHGAAKRWVRSPFDRAQGARTVWR
jgi:hypothetical protein